MKKIVLFFFLVFTIVFVFASCNPDLTPKNPKDCYPGYYEPDLDVDGPLRPHKK